MNHDRIAMPYIMPLIASIIMASAPAKVVDAAAVPAMLTGTAGSWEGELQYRDYQSNTWQGLPVTVSIVAQPDGVTTVRTALYDDGPQTGIVTITTATLVDPGKRTASYAVLRKARPTDTGLATITSVTRGSDPVHWSFVSVETRRDGDALAQVRETTTRDGDTMTTLKEVKAVDAAGDNWAPRNRSVLRRKAPSRE